MVLQETRCMFLSKNDKCKATVCIGGPACEAKDARGRVQYEEDEEIDNE